MRIVAQRQRGFAFQEMNRGRHWRCVRGQLLPRSETEQNDLDVIVIEQRMTQNALLGRLDLGEDIGNEGIGIHGVQYSFLETKEIARSRP